MSNIVSHAASVLRSKAPPSLGYRAMYANATASRSPNLFVFTSEGVALCTLEEVSVLLENCCNLLILGVLDSTTQAYRRDPSAARGSAGQGGSEDAGPCEDIANHRHLLPRLANGAGRCNQEAGFGAVLNFSTKTG